MHLTRMSNQVEAAIGVLFEHLRKSECSLDDRTLDARAAVANWLRGAHQLNPIEPDPKLPEDLVVPVIDEVLDFVEQSRDAQPTREAAQMLLVKLDALLDTVVWDESQPQLVLVTD